MRTLTKEENKLYNDFIKDEFGYDVILNKNGYALVRLGSDGDKTMKYTYCSEIYLEPGKEFRIKGTRKEIINSCKKSLKLCNEKLRKYKRKKLKPVINFLEKQKEALKMFIFVLEEIEV